MQPPHQVRLRADNEIAVVQLSALQPRTGPSTLRQMLLGSDLQFVAEEIIASLRLGSVEGLVRTGHHTRLDVCSSGTQVVMPPDTVTSADTVDAG